MGAAQRKISKVRPHLYSRRTREIGYERVSPEDCSCCLGLRSVVIPRLRVYKLVLISPVSLPLGMSLVVARYGPLGIHVPSHTVSFL